MLTEKLVPGLRILFIGFNPSLRSYERGFNYAGRSNRFYKVLYLANLTRRLYTPEESFSLVEDYGYGFTNIVARPSRSASELTKQEYREGALQLRAKLEQYRPQCACYVGRGVYTAFAGTAGLRRTWGFAPVDQVQGIRDFVAPSTSGLVRMKMAEQVSIYAQLSE